jgi:hypothetical protein
MKDDLKKDRDAAFVIWAVLMATIAFLLGFNLGVSSGHLDNRNVFIATNYMTVTNQTIDVVMAITNFIHSKFTNQCEVETNLPRSFFDNSRYIQIQMLPQD